MRLRRAVVHIAPGRPIDDALLEELETQLLQADVGVDATRTILEQLRGHTSGLAVPYFVIDAPGGGGKIPILPQYVLYHDDQKIVIRNYKYEVFEYDEVTGQTKAQPEDVDQRFLRKSPVILRERRRRASKPKTRATIKVKMDKPAEE
ncbi:MAG: hypothetical protein B7Z63_05795 [Ignavibacteriae bacterium 37-53-5]|nr:MAG: hypothetical protein B7Z63_05795 [Ignavibacteriae bacterium 37-53-5]